MGNCKAKETQDSFEETFSLVTEDQQEYRKYHHEVILRFIENNFEIVETSIQNNLYSKISHCGLGIPKHHIDDTIKSYIDYMILWAFRNSKGQHFELLPPFCIEMCLRIHILYSVHFKQFLSLLQEPNNNFKFDYQPKKMIPSGDLTLKTQYVSAYNDALITLGMGHCDFIWEHPQRSFLKNEFSFCFTSTQRKEEFNKFHMKNYSVAKMRSYEPEDIYSFAMNYRKRSGLDSINEVKGNALPTLIDKLVSNTSPENMEIAKKIDGFVFSENFLPTLMWEQMIGIEEAMVWMLEYKKFLYLIFTEGKTTVISPSEKVDQVWHLHLQHYQNYIDTIGSICFMDHGPSKGGREENIKFSQFYDQSVEFLKRHFGTLNTEIWAVDGNGRYGEQGEFLVFFPQINKKLWGDTYLKAKRDHELGLAATRKVKKNNGKKSGKMIKITKKKFDEVGMKDE